MRVALLTMSMMPLVEFDLPDGSPPEVVLYDSDVFVRRDERDGVVRYQSALFVFVRSHADLQAVVAVH